MTRQREDGKRLAEARGWVVEDIYVDNDTSASGKVERPEFERMLADFAAGRFSVIVSRDMDRLTRNRRDRLRLLELGEASGMVLAFVRGTDLDLSTPSGRLTADILASVARHEIEQMGDRRRRANVQKAEMGLPSGGRRPFGYCQHQRVNGVEVSRTCRDKACPGSMRSVVPAEAEVVRWCAEQLIGGRGLWSLVADLTERGIGTTAGGPWHHSELRRMLVNPRYAGRRVHRGVDVGPAAWPAILDPDTFAAVRAVITDPARARRGAPARYFLSSLAVCGRAECGRPIYGGPARGLPTYSCASRRHVAVRADWVDEYVVEVLAARMAEPDAADLFVEDAGVDVAGLRRREAGLRARLDGLAEAFASEDIDRAQLRAGTSRLRAELAEVTAAMRPVVVPGVADLLAGGDVEAAVRAAYADDPARLRPVLGWLAEVRLHSPGRGARSFRDEQVEFVWRAAGS